jgi:hypothetical protein
MLQAFSQLSQGNHPVHTRKKQNPILKPAIHNNISARPSDLSRARVSPLFFLGNKSTNKTLSQRFDKAFQQKDADEFLRYINETLLSLQDSPLAKDKLAISMEGNLKYPDHAIVRSGQTSVNVLKNGHIQINNQKSGPLFISNTELKEFMDEQNAALIGDGIRGLDPADQYSWEKMPDIKTQWPPDMNTTLGPIQLKADKSGQAIMFDAPDSVGKAYKTKPRGLISVDPADDSVIVAFQQTNNNPDFKLGSWTIAPFKVPAGKRVVAAFPVEQPFIDKYKEAQQLVSGEIKSPTESQKANDLQYLIGQEQWNLDKDQKVMLLNPEKPGNMNGMWDNVSNWTVYAVEGSDQAVVMRSIYRNTHPDQLKAFILGGDAKYTELELTSPRVKKGEKSTLIYKIDFVPLKDIFAGNEQKFDKFTAENMNEQVTVVTGLLKDKITDIRRSTKKNLDIKA